MENYGGVKVKSQGDVDSQNQGKDMCSNKFEFLALNEKAGYLEIQICEVNAHLGEYLVEIFVGNCPHMVYHP